MEGKGAGTGPRALINSSGEEVDDWTWKPSSAGPGETARATWARFSGLSMSKLVVDGAFAFVGAADPVCGLEGLSEGREAGLPWNDGSGGLGVFGREPEQDSCPDVSVR